MADVFFPPDKDLTQIRADFHIEPYDQSGRVARFLEAFAAILKHTNYQYILDHHARMASKCGRCAVQCPVYQATGLARDVPCERSNLLLRVYRRHFTVGGQLRARIFGEPPLTEGDIDVMAEAMYRCTACRRCNFDCPFGLDHGLMTHLTRWILAEIGVVPKALQVAVREQLEGVGNTSGIPPAALRDTVEFLEEDLQDRMGIDIKFPLDVEGAEYVFFPAVSDYLLEPDTLMGMACVFHATGDSWTIGTGYYDGINYGLFYSDEMLERILRKEIEEVKRLGGKKILIGECGHASRTAKGFADLFSKKELGEAYPVVSLLEYTHRAVMSGKVRLDDTKITDRVTYHDPCNFARSGWVVDQPREVLKTFCKDFVEMTPRGRENYCCGGGGGTVSVDEMKEFRMEIAGRRKAEQLKATGAKYVVAPCANCKKQLSEIIDHYGLEMEVKGLHDLILESIVLQGARGTDADGGDGVEAAPGAEGSPGAGKPKDGKDSEEAVA